MTVFRENKLFAFYTGLVVLIVLLAVFAPYLAPQDPMAGNMKLVLQTPSAEHFLGTDKLGRDIFSRILCGTQISLFMALCLVALIAMVGTLVGVLAGFFGGWLETILMRFADMMLAFPGIVLAIAIAGILGGSVVNTILALLVVSWAKYARLVRSLVLRLRNQDFIQAAKIQGAKTRSILWRHILPN
ncbi:MAG: ABC transporter permease, partial [Selenomonas sp.]|nr:ABC transporter permease [Selenomonas sp.]